MPNLYTVPAGEHLAQQSAAFLLATLTPEALSQAALLLPTRRSCVVMRNAFQQQLGNRAVLLPRMLPLADSESTLVSLIGAEALPLLKNISPAMSESQQRYLLTQQIMAFEKRRMGGVTLHYALTLADTLMALQEQCARANITLTQEKLRGLIHADFATHWQQALLFLGILTDSWPEIEHEIGMTIAATREVALTQALTQFWQQQSPSFPVIAIGSTGSQHATAQLLKTIADAANGKVILPGLEPTMQVEEWNGITASHPLFHLKALIDLWPLKPCAITPLQTTTRSLWLDALGPMEHWVNAATAPRTPNSPLEGESKSSLKDFGGGQTSQQNPPTKTPKSVLAPPRGGSSEPTSRPMPKLIPCAHAEEEARVISLLLRETLESPGKRAALITPDEGLMARVASHLKRYGIQVDRLNAGTLATTESGSLWAAISAVLTAPESLLTLRSFFHQPLLNIDEALLHGLEKGWHGVNRRSAGQLPRHEASLKEHPSYAALAQLAKQLALLATQRHRASDWIAHSAALLEPWLKTTGQGHDAVTTQLEALEAADTFGVLDAEDFSALLSERLATPQRGAGINTHPNIAMLTPVEARLEHFDRIILANMQETMWPGTASPNPWLNLAAQTALGLPSREEDISRMAHDVLMLGSSGEVFLTYPKRDGGSPTNRSRFIERLVTLLAMQGVTESEITATEYIRWANALDASHDYAPETDARPTPTAAQRPRRLPVTDLDKLTSDPFFIYAKHVLGLRKLEDIDAAPEASDFGNLAHKAIEALTQHWNANARPATDAELNHITEHALRDFSDRPNIDLFWRNRLRNGLAYVNKLEAERRSAKLHVSAEYPVEESLTLSAGEAITLYGRIDRVETVGSGSTIIDYKTGDAPSSKKILEGRALQLLAYAMLLRQAGQSPAAIEYWALPKLGDEGEITHLDTVNTPAIADIEARLCMLLNQMLDPATPFLATGGDSQYGSDYDGISRYDEWAG